MTTTPETLTAIVEAYLIEHDVQPATARWYKRTASVFNTWHGVDAPREVLTTEQLSRFLKDKQDAGRSCYYVRGLRHALCALLGDTIDARKVRRIKLARLHPRTWSLAEVRKLLSSVPKALPAYKVTYYERFGAVAFHTGFSKNDLERLTRADVLDDGTIIFNRHKAGTDLVAWIPPELLEGLPQKGPLFPRRWSDEQFRRDVSRVVAAAGLVGSFKQLRKSSGTQADILTGCGHEHLGNSRRVFERHYLDRAQVHRKPTVLPAVLLGTSKWAGKAKG